MDARAKKLFKMVNDSEDGYEENRALPCFDEFSVIPVGLLPADAWKCR
jgi:hypothetical protein